MCLYRMPVKSKKKSCNDITLSKLGLTTIFKLAPCGLFQGLPKTRGTRKYKVFYLTKRSSS